MTELYKRLKAKGCSFNHVCEVGVYLPETSNIADFIKDGVRATLVEADITLVPKIKDYFKEGKITVYPVAIWDYNGKLKLSKAAASTFVSDLHSSPALTNDNYQKTDDSSFEVECRVFSDLDDGTIDLLSVDIEGSEWYVLKNLKSRPNVISVETHGKSYINPFLDEIRVWMDQNTYVIWYKDGSDSVYIKGNLFPFTLSEKLLLGYRNLWLNFRRNKSNFKKAVFN
ncbi:FkbM family methyltransferase [Larkinella insperata]|uniref:FkbM family methyltransferase n=1 Tax=Larkinella insperata TaxID=332158 RepID=A0ABW3QI45_9BACT|nr:FkbM family methyltransferase [Larkinella insperata]